jgi:hypothetical protein
VSLIGAGHPRAIHFHDPVRGRQRRRADEDECGSAHALDSAHAGRDIGRQLDRHDVFSHDMTVPKFPSAMARTRSSRASRLITFVRSRYVQHTRFYARA